MLKSTSCRFYSLPSTPRSSRSSSALGPFPFPSSPSSSRPSPRPIIASTCNSASDPTIRLATVLENLPLTYNTETKLLERTKSLGVRQRNVENEQGAAVAADQAVESPEDGSTPKFKRGHMRRSSYESAEIQLNFARRRTPNANKKISSQVSDVLSASSSLNSLSHSLGGCSLVTPSTSGDPSTSSAMDTDFVDLSREKIDECANESVDQSASSSEENAQFLPKTINGKKQFFLFSKNPFSRSKDASPNSGWKLFGSNKNKEHQGALMHTTGLILEGRPSNLPAKSEEEAEKHRKLYQDLLEQNKRKEEKLLKEKKQASIAQKRLEEQAAAACRSWTEQILPKWDKMKDSKRCHELWWQGLPPKVRGKVWPLAIGNELGITEEIYKLHLNQAITHLAEDELQKGAPISTLHRYINMITLDASRTFPKMGIFQKGGPYYEHLLRLLGAYVCYRPDIGYVQSMSFIAAIILLQMEPFSAFVAFSNLLNRPLQIAFFGVKQLEITQYFISYDRYFEQELPDLHKHFDKINLRPDLYLIDWIYPIYAKSLPLDVTCRIWDVYLKDGEEFLFNAALGILKMHQTELLSMDFEDALRFLTHLPEQLQAAQLFRHIETLVRKNHGGSKAKRKTFAQILSEVTEQINSGALSIENLMNGGSNGLSTLKMSRSVSGFVADLLSPTEEQQQNIPQVAADCLTVTN
ncbi:hypothetical protein WR25_05121 [Diploscapter pachys]|uniref:Rab-GAP TBC domain-containing protein n=1 Tax=Diploscapter pachys TaxID=2018661 RepID=A0A2A2KIK0_9BILA|nr:hypothetical protein WR25_05121 [Diploscapter pachys]